MQHSSTILIVDDASANLVILEKSLPLPEFTTFRAENGREALQLAEARLPDLVLLDLMMPEMDGLTVCRQLKANPKTHAIPVIFLTAMNDPKYLRDGFSAGAVDFVTKPFKVGELLARVRTHLEIHRLRNNLELEVAKRTQELSRTMQRLEESNEIILKRLGLAAEFRDGETSNHLKRMSRYSVLLGAAAGMDKATLAKFELASQMHDVGKIGIPDKILLKPGKLDEEERAIMYNHPTIGGELLEGIQSEIAQMAAQVALTHHEKFDGSGYPAGLKGNEIPLTGRIVAIADVFDALTSQRPYKAAWTVDDAIAYILAGSGTHFDPQLVEHFRKSVPEILKIRENLLG
jgi:putative two-component system response regulator